MGRNASNHSESPVRGRDSPRRRSPKRSHRSPARKRDSSPRREKNYRRSVSPKRARPDSPASPSPSPPTRRSRRAQDEKLYDREHDRNARGGDKRTPRSPDRENHSNHKKSSSRPVSVSPSSRSPSPRTKRLKRAQADREAAEKVTKRDRDRSNEREADRGSHREREHREKEREKLSEREVERERRDRRSRREEADGKSSRPRHGRSASPSGHHGRSRQRSQSPHPHDYDARHEVHNSRGSEQGIDEDHDDSVAKMKAAEEALQAKDKQKPSFELSGKLAAETNRVKGVTLLFNEPPDARKPDIRWRLYVFKGGEVLNEPLYIHRQTCYLFGRERRVADIPTDHPSCSKQHALIQFRQVEKENSDGTMSKQVRPYLMDLGSTNKTFLNDNPIEPQRYYELFEKDTIKFGNSSREYVLLHENSVQ